MYEPHTIVRLPTSASERELARNVLAELNPTWENQFSHTFTEAIPNVVSECKLVRKNEERSQKRKIVTQINEQFSENGRPCRR